MRSSQILWGEHGPNWSIMEIKWLPYTCKTLSALRIIPYALSTFLNWLYTFCNPGTGLTSVPLMWKERLREITCFDVDHILNKGWNQDFNLGLLIQKSVVTYFLLYLHKHADMFLFRSWNLLQALTLRKDLNLGMEISSKSCRGKSMALFQIKI